MCFRLFGIALPAALLASMILACASFAPRSTPQPTREIAPTFTPLQLVAPTVTVEPTATPAPVLEPTATAIAPAQAPPVSAGPTANDVANVRSGPGTEHPTVGSVAAGQSLTIVGRNGAGDWYQLADGNWIAAFLVTGAPTDLPVVEAAPVAAPTAVPVVDQPTAAPVATDTPFVVATVPPAAVCDCSGDTLNCGDFDSAAAAHACYDYCMATTGLDVHDLDGDEDGQFCESQ